MISSRLERGLSYIYPESDVVLTDPRCSKDGSWMTSQDDTKYTEETAKEWCELSISRICHRPIPARVSTQKHKDIPYAQGSLCTLTPVLAHRSVSTITQCFLSGNDVITLKTRKWDTTGKDGSRCSFRIIRLNMMGWRYKDINRCINLNEKFNIPVNPYQWSTSMLTTNDGD